MYHEKIRENPGKGKIPAPALIALAAVVVLCLVLLALCPGKKGAGEKRSDTAGPSSHFKAKSAPPAEYKQKARPEIRLSINDSPDSQVLYSDLECLFRIRILNQRAQLARMRTREREILEASLGRQVSEGRVSESEAEKRLEDSPDIKPEPLLAGTKEVPWIAMVHIYALPADAEKDTQPVELFPEGLGSGEDKAGQLKLDEENEGLLQFAGSPSGLGVAPGDYLIFASLEAPDSSDLPENHFRGEVRSAAIPISVEDSAGVDTAEVQDLRTYAQARIAFERGNMEEAMRLLDEGTGSNPDAPLSLTLRADMLEEEGRYGEAYESLKQALDAVLKKTAGTEEFTEPPSYLAERLNQLRKKIEGGN
jgi:tetratricopeptide (TPR) repeat protein